MPVPPKLYRSLRESRNVSLDSIYDYLMMIAGTQMRHTNRLNELTMAQEQLTAKLDRIIEQLEAR